MNKEINKTYNSLPEEEKEQLKKFEKKGITEVKQKVDQQTGEILSTETNYNSETKRKKGTFYIGSPLELQKIAQGSKVRAINKMLVYILDVVNWNNEFTFDKPFIESYGEKNKQRFFTDRKYLLENQYIFNKPYKKNVYTLNVELFSRGNAYTTSQLYKEQFEENLEKDIELDLIKTNKKLVKFNKNQLEQLKNKIDNLLKNLE